MSTAIIYATRHGCTERAARLLKENLGDGVSLFNLNEDKIPPLEQFDTIIIGGSIHIGKIQGKIKKFCQKNLTTLTRKQLGLFLCCLEEGEKRQQQFENAFPAELRSQARARGMFGGEVNLEELNFILRAMFKKEAGVTGNVSRMDKKEIIRFAEQMKG